MSKRLLNPTPFPSHARNTRHSPFCHILSSMYSIHPLPCTSFHTPPGICSCFFHCSLHTHTLAHLPPITHSFFGIITSTHSCPSQGLGLDHLAQNDGHVMVHMLGDWCLTHNQVLLGSLEQRLKNTKGVEVREQGKSE